MGCEGPSQMEGERKVDTLSLVTSRPVPHLVWWGKPCSNFCNARLLESLKHRWKTLDTRGPTI